MPDINKPILNICFDGFWDKDDIIFEHYFKNSHRFLFEKYDIRVVEKNSNPDVIFCSVFSNDYVSFRTGKAPRIMLIHENIKPNSNWFDTFDYIISFTNLKHKNHIQIPYWMYRFHEHGLPISHYINKTTVNLPEFVTQLKPKFCNFIYSNPFFFRKEFAHELSKTHKQVDFCGRVDNNLSDSDKLLITPSKLGTQGLIQKREFLKKYRFTITFENSSTLGYTTEKILDAYAGNTIPVYWGNPKILDEGFNPESFINYYKVPGNKQCIEQVRAIDSSNDLLCDMLNSDMLSGTVPDALDTQYMIDLYTKMFEKKDINT